MSFLAEQVAVTKPELTFPENVAERVRAEYAKARTILEYGSGGSTVLAAEQPGKKVFSVESDPKWAQMMQDYLQQHHPQADVTMHYANIGKTREWGLPVHYSKLNAFQYRGYAHSVWRRPDFVAPDIILIDGRFRIGCLFVALKRIQRPTRILFDDFTDREVYRFVETFITPQETIGRMAVFDAIPRKMPALQSISALKAEIWP